ncbi:MAG: hypothetical protein LBV69_06320 [Bacteroidales bacterium]|jgi:hypothetical protein|nr:hypothetical protein [Bacteroidales bacterium]
MLISTKEEHINFLKTNILDSIKILLNEKQIKFAFLLMGQATEILGAYLDKKPIRAKQQSAARFELAIYKLFPEEYKRINKSNFLYYQLRNFLIHSFIPSKNIILKSDSEKSFQKHLSFENGCLILFADIFYSDLELAINKLIKYIEIDKIKLKKISGSDVEEY